MSSDYLDTRSQLEDYFDRKAADTWERLTSDAPVSKVRETVRAGRDEMRATMMSRLPADMTGRRVLDAGCGPGSAAIEMARRGAEVVAMDVSASLLEVARKRTPHDLKDRIDYRTGDMADPGGGTYDHIFAMDSLIHYRVPLIADVLASWFPKITGNIVFTVAPKTPLLTVMWNAGKLFPRSDRSPAIAPAGRRELEKAISVRPLLAGAQLLDVGRISRGFYISQAMELQ
ncbi:MAG: magnesium protoporphyrin IX methyltransferase [Pseudomonadota bacterium]